jgi:hypothetical protein
MYVNSIPMLLSAARREFLKRKEFQRQDIYDGPQMQAMGELLERIGLELHLTGFTWSKYNTSVWENYVECPDEDGGTAVFSLEADGHWDESMISQSFKGLFVGGPLGYYPYEIWLVNSDTSKLDDLLREWKEGRDRERGLNHPVERR